MNPRTLPPSFSREQALALGWTDWYLARAVRDGLVARTGHGRYALPAEEGFPARRAAYLARAEAALVAHPGGHVLSHLTAAVAHGLPMPLHTVSLVHLTVDTALHRSRRRAGVVLHHGDSVTMEPVLAAGLPCTPVARTLADCLRVHGPGVCIPLVDEALRVELCTLDEVEAALATQVRWRGRPRARRLLDLVDGRRESWLESFAAVTLSRLGIVTPTPQVVVSTSSGRFVGRVDGIWAEDNTAIEVDGREKYRLPRAAGGESDPEAAFEAQRVRHDELTNLGLEVVRVDLPRLLGPGADLRRTVDERRAAGRARTFTGRLTFADSSGKRRTA